MTTNTVLLSTQKYAAGGTAWTIGINTAGTFTLLSSGTVDVDVYWGDGDVETVTTNSVDHTYPSAGTYTIGIKINSGNFYPYYFIDPAGDELITLGDTPTGWSFGNSLYRAFRGSSSLTTVGDIDTSSVRNFSGAWRDCTSLTSFPLLDTSNATNVVDAWYACTNLDNISTLGEQYSFPLIDTSKVEQFINAWYNCDSLTSFPPIDLSAGINLANAWFTCSALTSFPLLPAGKRPVAATSFNSTWKSCINLETFPANFFDDWTGTPSNNCFVNAWENCNSLTATSVENILNSIAASAGQQNAPGTNPDITIDYDAGTGTPNITTAVTNLKARNWTITLNGVLQ